MERLAAQRRDAQMLPRAHADKASDIDIEAVRDKIRAKIESWSHDRDG